MKNKPSPNKSVTNMYINTIGMLLSLFWLWYCIVDKNMSDLTAVLLVCFWLALPIIVLEIIFLKNHKKASTGLDFSAKAKSQDNTILPVKYFGLLMTVASVAFIYWIFPEYNGSFYDRYYRFLTLVVPIWMLIAIPYFFFINRYMKNPKDGYWHLGMLFLGKFSKVDFNIISQHYLGWLVKLFFLPLMFIYMSDKIVEMRNYQYDQLLSNFQSFYDFFFSFIFYIDLLFVTVGYMCTIRLFDAHIRSAEYTFLGWVIALICYQPFWSLFSDLYISYGVGTSWGHWFWSYPVAYGFWGSLILVLIGIYTWASVAFGIRFSNLTNRGILTNGPYRYTKHPAYISKNLSWWLISMPFISNQGILVAVKGSLLLLLLNFVYFMRARTEERHLSFDPDYVAYAKYIEDHGIFSRLGKTFPVLKFKQGQLFNTDTTMKPRLSK